MALAERPGVAVDWLPYTLDIPSFLGAAELDESGRDIVGERNAHQWRRVRYIYMDCRREARRRGIVLRGPKKIFDSTPAHLGFLFARRRGSPRDFHDRVYERFWRRELDIGDPTAIASILDEVGPGASGFDAWCAEEGRTELAEIQRDAEEAGVFGVPSYRVGDELFWGTERLERVAERVSRRDPA